MVFLAPKRSTQAACANLLLGTRDRGLRPRAGGLLLDHRFGVGAGVERDGSVVDVQRMAGDVVQEALVVGDDHRAAGVAGQELLQPADGEDVEVVGRLVEQQHVDAAHQHLRQEDAQLETARQRRQRRAVKPGRDRQPLEHLAGAGLQCVAVVRGDDVLEIPQASGVDVALSGGQALLLFERVPDDGVPAHRQIGNDGVVRRGSDPAAARRSARAWRWSPSRRASSSPARTLRKVVFPDPFAPTRP